MLPIHSIGLICRIFLFLILSQLSQIAEHPAVDTFLLRRQLATNLLCRQDGADRVRISASRNSVAGIRDPPSRCALRDLNR